MKKAKYILFGVIAFIAILLIVAIFLPKDYSLSAEKKVDASKLIVFNLLANLENRSQWDPITHQSEVLLDSNNNSSNFSWSDDKNLSGKIIVNKSDNDSKIILNSYKGDLEYPSIIEYTLGSDIGESATNVVLEYTGRSPWPNNLMNIVIKRKKANKLIEELEELEIVAKERQVDRIYNGYKIVEDIVKERNFITRRDTIAAEAIQQFYVQNLGVLFNKVQSAGLEMDGMPCGLFYTKDIESKTMDMAAAIPVSEEVNVLGAETENIKTRTAIVVDYYGDYSNTIRAHKAIKNYMDDYAYVIDTPIIEEYVTDPGIEKDPNKWLTRITYYIASN